ncbi:MAG TPA: hypothetical protein PLL30_14075 [Candidatus Krumholzibacteria bacterium]|nr:hypothetical protein [Candidatus Krumholzibacteria bacterium]HPD72893.1 hypothetical protein [Candidatus Krumholzibacteria bacterium]HRY41692.1 hypothetical protein [Candidatus Krumholzibacteria bacterium]
MRKTLTYLMLLFVSGWLAAGCESDETAPQDRLPLLESEDVAGQAGYLALAVVELAPLALEYDGGKADASDGNYAYTFAAGGPIEGTVLLHFELDGAPSGYDVADYAAAFTADASPLRVTIVEGGVPWLLAADLETDLDQGAGTAVAYGSGTLTVGGYEATWTLAAVAVADAGQWPASGELTFTNEGITATVTYDGDDTATVEVGDSAWVVNLNDGTLTPVI